MNGEYLTIKELAKKLDVEIGVVKMRLFRLGIKPVTAEALYDISALEAIRNVPGKGRPKKAAEPASKSKKPKK